MEIAIQAVPLVVARTTTASAALMVTDIVLLLQVINQAQISRVC
jgi:hypothetical protein